MAKHTVEAEPQASPAAPEQQKAVLPITASRDVNAVSNAPVERVDTTTLMATESTENAEATAAPEASEVANVAIVKEAAETTDATGVTEVSGAAYATGVTQPPEATEAVDALEAADTIGATDIPDAPDATEIPDATGAAEIADIPETTALADALEAADTRGATEFIDALDAMEVTEATEVAGITRVTEIADATGATDALDATEATEATEDPEITNAPDATEATDAPEATDITGATETADATGATVVPDAPDVPDATEATEATEVTVTLDAPDAPEAVEVSKSAKASEVTEITETAENTETAVHAETKVPEATTNVPPSTDDSPTSDITENPDAQHVFTPICLDAPTHTRSYKSTPEPSQETDTVSPLKSSSTSELPTVSSTDDNIATKAPTPVRRPPVRHLPSSLSSSTIDDQDISTIPDPRLRPLTSGSGEKSSGAADEITALSTKLIDAINRQSTLDDTLSRTRMDLDESNKKIRQLEALVKRQKEFLAGGLWVRRSTVEEEKAVVFAKAREEKRLRMEAEAQKAKMELELETLTAELFQQANKMVTTAKEEARAEQVEAQRRYDNLKGQLADTEGLLRSQQEQLTELKQVMEEMIKNEVLARDDQTTALTTPTSPSFAHFDFKDGDSSSDKAIEASVEIDAPDGAPATDDSAQAPTEPTVAAVASPMPAAAPTPLLPPQASPDVALQSPSQPMSFTHLLRPVLRYDTTAFQEFVDLIRTAQMQLMLQQQLVQQAHSRSPSSTSLPKAPSINTASWNGQPQSQAAPSTLSMPLSAMNTWASVASGLTSSSNGPPPPQNHAKELRETKFYKRVVVEDIEPTLRLDTAPGVSWLVRRNIMTAIVEGTLVAEPVPATTICLSIQSACALCGENRRQIEYSRQHRFRLTESDKSTPYSLCNYCLSRVRSVCGFLVFLRMIKEGHWRAPDEESEQAAWEECVRLREHMFWARIGGGVLPAVGLGSGSHGFGGLSRRHSRAAGGGSSAQNSINFHTSSVAGSNRPSIELPSQLNTPSKININGSPLASPPLSPNHPGLGIGSGERASSSSTPNRPSRLSVSVAAMVSGLGGHVA